MISSKWASKTCQITLRHLSSAGARIDLSSMRFQCDMTKISNSCGLCGLMKPVLRPTSAHLAFSSRPSVPLLITNSKKEFDIMTAMKYVRNCEDESRILNDLHRITIFSLLQSPLRALGI
ncbi:conserved hypothetical protein [Trichinella spiralis]|uniref:hypothetical protein n=1 Tax=Trichinella spiralis TaxID=6334 RepID=UPI0001EFE26C|nr:conserved hypothetical protein [Trichinella spiralis]